MTKSLLAHLYPYIKGSQEDVATYSLQYLLMQSEKLNIKFTKMVAEKMNIKLENKLQYLCQVSGESEEMERPDMVGLDSEKNEVVLFEMKFYASLTQNQPNTYIKRLMINKGKGLIFICPEARKTILWDKLKELCDDKSFEEIDDFCIETSGIRLCITTWSEIIKNLKDSTSSDENIYSDILQLEGYCNKMDSDAFIPFCGEDLSAKWAIKEQRYYDIIDEVSNLLFTEKTVKCSKKGSTNANKYGYAVRFVIKGFYCELLYDRLMWKNPETEETPFWIAISNKNREQTHDMIKKFRMYPERQWDDSVYGWTYLALEALQNSTKAEVCEDLKNKILKYINEINTTK